MKLLTYAGHGYGTRSEVTHSSGMIGLMDLGVPALFAPLATPPRIEKQALVMSPTDSRAGNVMWLLSVGGRAYAGRNGDL